MHPFTDSKGRAWELSLTIGSARRLINVPVGRDEKPVDLLSPESGDPPALTRLATDPWTLVDVVYLLVKPQADARQMSDEEFGEDLGGEALEAASRALWEEIADFFRQSIRPDVVRAIEKQRAITEKGIELATRRIERLDPDTLLQAAMAAMDGTESGKRPASSELIRSP